MDTSPALLFGAVATAMLAVTFAWLLRPLWARHGRVLLGAAAALPLAAAGLYAILGDLRGVDERHTVDASTAVQTVPASALRDDLVAQLARNPRDARGLIMLARLDMDEDRFADAAAAYAKAIDASPNAAKDAGVWCEYADALGMAQGGTLAGRPRELVMEALLRDPAHPKALEMAGSGAYDERDYAAAVRHWRALRAQLAPGSEGERDLAAAIERAELMASATLAQASQGELLYSTHCLACHTQQIHWRERRLVSDWASLVSETRRWQRNAGLGWSDEDIDEVARYLNTRIYHLPEQRAKQAG